MTSLFKLIFFTILALSITQAKASMIALYFEEGQKQNAQIVTELINKKFEIPTDLIRQIKVTSCELKDSRFYELCINKKGELYQLSQFHFNNYKDSFLVFKKEGGSYAEPN